MTFPLSFLAAGVEDGQTVRMPVGRKEIFITFRVGVVFLAFPPIEVGFLFPKCLGGA